MRDISRLVFWSDASCSSGRHSLIHGFAITWRRSEETHWGPWEAEGYQCRGASLGSPDVEALGVAKALDKACQLVRETPGQFKAVSIYTDSASALGRVATEDIKSGEIASKAGILTGLGVTVSLHWCPGHSSVSTNLQL